MNSLFNFRDEKLLRQALTHSSYANENPGESHNERLEFLGDALLTFIAGEYLYQKYPNLAEDDLTRQRSALVNEKQLAKFAQDLGLDAKMRLSKGTIQSGGFQNANLLSSTFEAIVAAYYLDHDRNIELIRPLLEDLFESVSPHVLENRSNVDSKNRLQEWVHSHFNSLLPQYQTDRVGGLDHAPIYLSQVFVQGQLYGQGSASGKKEAEKRAAEDALNQLCKNGLI